ncbi:Predicted arabinose efflux permease, MFS family [Thermomonospora echinospora]|uniref:Predicted arabinose efflux permease, MFS family n=1 Tax=Thermomonospora echinospora TaxID=1992 RepID=A0A1H5UWI6_9ACTN|nr:MFS transporter [Thermomonospora echinospora]SEF79366.1 Predicted arabinose efflux permease, MFS family [Thermomonospora echinospora]
MLFRARLGTFLTFALGGLLCGVWVARMPALTDKFGIGPGAAGMVLLVWGVAALAAMQGLRGVIARVGSRAVLRIAAPLAAATAALVALAPSYPLLLAAIAVFGMAFGVMDVAMNAQASVVERAHRRPLMSGMHAGWCVGAMTGGLIGALTAFAGLSFTQTLLGAALAALPAALALGRTYLADAPAAAAGPQAGERGRLPLAVYLIGALAFIAFMAEGAVADWSGLMLHDELHAAEWVAALGYPLFESAMLAGRLVGDRLRTRLGTRRLLVTAGAGTAAGATVVVCAPAVPMALAGFFLTGLMVCTIVPTMISLAGTTAPGRSSAAVAQVGAMGYGGLLLGPVIIGFLAEATSLRVGLGMIVVLALLIAVGARLLPIAADADLAAEYALAEARAQAEHKPALSSAA